jgi:hypothetical protein
MAVDNRIHILARFAELAMTMLLDMHESQFHDVRGHGDWG